MGPDAAESDPASPARQEFDPQSDPQLTPVRPFEVRFLFSGREHVRNGVTQTFLEVERLPGHRHVEPSPRRTRQDWARTIAERLEIHYTPKHASWLIIAEVELSVLSGRCLNCRISDQEAMRAEIDAWLHDRNTRHSTVDWQFITVDARIKLKHLYPKLN